MRDNTAANATQAPTTTLTVTPTLIDKPNIGYALPPLTVFDMIFDRCHGDNLIAIGSRCPSRTKPEPFPHALIAVPVSARWEWLPEIFAHEIGHTQYFMPNTLHPAALIGKRETQIGPHARARWFAACNRNVAELCALVVDLDCYHEPLNIEAADALGQAVTMVLRGELPMPAMAAYSGRGAYLVWLLRDETAAAPPPATADNAAAWQLIAAELVNRTAGLGGDPNARHLANWYKRPGTVDTKTGREVTYMAFGGDNGFMPYHRLSELQEFLGTYHHQIDAQPVPTPPEARGRDMPLAPLGIRHRKKPEDRQRKVKLGQGGQSARARVAEIERLSQHRGGFRANSPSRHIAAWVYFLQLRAYLRACSEDDPEAQAKAERDAFDRTVRFARTFVPPLTTAEVAVQIKSPKQKKPPKWFCASTLARMLGVTIKEAEALDLRAIAPEAIRASLGLTQEARRQAADAARAGRAERNNRMDSMIGQGRNDAEIAAELGISRMTVWRRRQRLRKPTAGLFEPAA